MKRIAFITSSEDPQLTSDDRLTIPAFEKMGISVAPLVWDQPHEFNFDAYVFRSCWNYHRKYNEFSMWLRSLENLKAPIMNSLASAHWNIDKIYLLELSKKGAPVPRTTILSASNTNEEILESIKSFNSDIVIKPTVSLNGHDTFHMTPAQIPDSIMHVQNLLKATSVIIQDYIPEVKTVGEISLMFIEGKFSHAIRKLAAPGEFRIHSEYGGTRESFEPSLDIIEAAGQIVAMYPEDLLSVRVDFIETASGPQLVELEILDPMLFFQFSKDAIDRFVTAVSRRL